MVYAPPVRGADHAVAAGCRRPDPAAPRLCEGGSPSLALGSPAPDFTLPGIDGTHAFARRLREQPGPGHRLHVQHLPGVAVVRGTPQEAARRLSGQGRRRVVAINPNKPEALQLADLGHTDVGESLDDMKIRAAHRPHRVSRTSPTATPRRSRGSSASWPRRRSSCSIRRARCGTRGESTTTRVEIAVTSRRRAQRDRRAARGRQVRFRRAHDGGRAARSRERCSAAGPGPSSWPVRAARP